MFSLPRESAKRLETLESVAQFAAVNDAVLDKDGKHVRVKNDDTGKLEREYTQYISCKIIDKRTGKVWVKAKGDDERSAFKAAMVMTGSAKRPQTPAEIATENIELRKQLDAWKSGQQELQTDPIPEAEPEVVESEETSELTNDELADMIKARGLKLPMGARNDVWRTKALGELKEVLVTAE